VLHGSSKDEISLRGQAKGPEPYPEGPIAEFGPKVLKFRSRLLTEWRKAVRKNKVRRIMVAAALLFTSAGILFLIWLGMT